MRTLAQILCSIFENAMKPPTLDGIAICPEERMVLAFSAAPQQDVAWLRSLLPEAQAALPISEIQSYGFKADGRPINRETAELAATKSQCEGLHSVNVFPGSTILQNRQGTLGCIVRVEGAVHLVSAEHLLALKAQEPILLSNGAGVFMVAQSTALNGGLTASNSPSGDFELGRICATSAIKLNPMPCGAIQPTGNWVHGAGFDAICGLAVHACVGKKLREATVLGVSACLDVLYSSLPSAKKSFKRFSGHVILKAKAGSGWDRGDSGAMVFAAEDRGSVRTGDALGIMFAISDGYLCVTPFERIVATLKAQGMVVELMV